MAQNLITNGEGGLSVRNDINNNFSELYTFALSTNKFQPNPDYLTSKDVNATVTVNNGVGGVGVLFRDSSTQYSAPGYGTYGGYAIVFNYNSSSKWSILFADNEDESNPAEATTTGGTYPWSVTYNNGYIVTRNPDSRVLGTALSATVIEGTSIYAARADHNHPIPQALDINAAPLVNGLIPSTYLPSYVDDVIEVLNYDSLPKNTYVLTGSATVDGNYVQTAVSYNNSPTYVNGLFTLRRTPVPARWQVVLTSTGYQYLLATTLGNSSNPIGFWPYPVKVVFDDKLSPAIGKIYITTSDKKIYRWSGSTYVQIGTFTELATIQYLDSESPIIFSYLRFSNVKFPRLNYDINGKPGYQGNVYESNGDYAGAFYVKYDMGFWGLYSADSDSDYLETRAADGNEAYPWLANWSSATTTIQRIGSYDDSLLAKPLGLVAKTGTSEKAAREDHIHPLPYQPNPDYNGVQVYQSKAVLGGSFSGAYNAFYRVSSTVYTPGGWPSGGGVGLVFNATTYLGDAGVNKWALLNDDGEGGVDTYAIATTTGGDYPWDVSYSNGVVVTREAAARIIKPLSGTASEGTSVYAARADHTHLYPTVAQIGAAPVVDGLIPEQYMPLSVDDVSVYTSILDFPNTSYTVTTNASVSGYNSSAISGVYKRLGQTSFGNSQSNRVYRKYFTLDSIDPINNGNYLELIKSAVGYNNWVLRDKYNKVLLSSNGGGSRPDSVTWPTGTRVTLTSDPESVTYYNNKIFVDLTNGKSYTWSSGIYNEISTRLQQYNIPDEFQSILFLYGSGSGSLQRYNVIFQGGTLSTGGSGRNSYTYFGNPYIEYSEVDKRWRYIEDYYDENTGDYTGSNIVDAVTGTETYPWDAKWTGNLFGVTRSYNRDNLNNNNYIVNYPIPLPMAEKYSSGVSPFAAREDHVHPFPTALTLNDLTIKTVVSLSGLPTYATNSAAVAGGLAVNRIYKTSTGELRIVI